MTTHKYYHHQKAENQGIRKTNTAPSIKNVWKKVCKKTRKPDDAVAVCVQTGATLCARKKNEFVLHVLYHTVYSIYAPGIYIHKNASVKNHAFRLHALYETRYLQAVVKQYQPDVDETRSTKNNNQCLLQTRKTDPTLSLGLVPPIPVYWCSNPSPSHSTCSSHCRPPDISDTYNPVGR